MCLKFVLIYEDLETKITIPEKLAVIYPRILYSLKYHCTEHAAHFTISIELLVHLSKNLYPSADEM